MSWYAWLPESVLGETKRMMISNHQMDLHLLKTHRQSLSDSAQSKVILLPSSYATSIRGEGSLSTSFIKFLRDNVNMFSSELLLFSMSGDIHHSILILSHQLDDFHKPVDDRSRRTRTFHINSLPGSHSAKDFVAPVLLALLAD